MIVSVRLRRPVLLIQLLHRSNGGRCEGGQKIEAPPVGLASVVAVVEPSQAATSRSKLCKPCYYMRESDVQLVAEKSSSGK